MNEEIAPQANEITLRMHLDLLRRRKAIIVQTFFAVVAVAIVATFMSKPVYRTMARILVEGKAFTVTQFNANDPLSNLFVPSGGHDVDTQLEVLQSASLQQQAYQEAGVRPDSVQLTAKQVATTDVIELTCESTDARAAERFAQTLPNTYLKYVMGNRKTEITQTLVFARSELATELRKLDDAQRRLEQFRRKTHVTNLETERADRITRAGTADTDARRAEADMAAAQVRLDMLIGYRKSLPAFVDTPTTTTNQQQIDMQAEKITLLQTERSKLLRLYKPNHVEIQKVDAQIGDLQAHLSKLPPTITTVTRAPNPERTAYDDKITEAEGALAAARTQVSEARANAVGLTAGLGKYNSIERQHDQLRRDVDQHTSRVDQLSKSVDDLSLREKATHDPVLTITTAGRAKQVAPKKLNNLLFSMFAGIFLSLVFALLQDYLDDRINNPDEARRLLGMPALGYVPMVEMESARLLRTTRAMTDAPSGSAPENYRLLESYRLLRSNVQFANVDGSVRSILVTSTEPGEGKSVTAANLAVAMAMDERRVILVDCDLRRPTTHKNFGLSKQPGLTGVLLGTVSLEQALHDTDVAGLRVLTSGVQPPNPAEMLNSNAMHRLLEALEGMADMVIIDSPPCLATADAQVLASKVDGVLYVIQIGAVKRSAVRHSLELLQQAHARVLGTIFSKVDLSSSWGSYYYGYSYRYGYDATPQLEGAPMLEGVHEKEIH